MFSQWDQPQFPRIGSIEKKLQPIHSSTWPCPFCQLQAEEAGCLVVGLQGMPHKAQMVQESWIIINAVYKCDCCFICIYIYTLLYVMFISYPWLYITRVYIYIHTCSHVFNFLSYAQNKQGDAVRTMWDSPDANSINHPRFFHQTWIEMVGKKMVKRSDASQMVGYFLTMLVQYQHHGYVWPSPT